MQDRALAWPAPARLLDALRAEIARRGLVLAHICRERQRHRRPGADAPR